MARDKGQGEGLFQGLFGLPAAFIGGGQRLPTITGLERTTPSRGGERTTGK